LGLINNPWKKINKSKTKIVTEGVEDAYGNLQYTTPEESEQVIAGCLVAWGASNVEVDMTGYEFEEIITIYAPQNSDIKASDDIVWKDETWRPIGKPIQWTTQVNSPNKPRLIVVCKLVTEGYI